MTTAQRNTVHRIDHERRTLTNTLRTSLTRAALRLERTAIASSNPAATLKAGSTFLDATQQLATLAYLTGMRRTVIDASRILRRDVRVGHYELSRKDGEEDRRRRDLILAIIAFLMLTPAQVAAIRQRSATIAANAAQELTTPLVRQLAKAIDSGGTSSGGLLEYMLPAITTTPTTPTSPAAMRRSVSQAFNAAGVGQESTRQIDTWSQAVAYHQYEVGRFDGTKLPAIAEALWGYHWCSVLDARTTQGCQLLDGWVAPITDTWMKALAPPRHWHCRSVLVPVYQTSQLRPPIPFRPEHLTDATLDRLLRDKEAFLARLV